MPEIGETGVAFTMVAREWRAKYAMDADGTPAKSTALKAAQALLAEYLPKLKEIPSAEITRVVCGGCGDFKVIINQPAAEHCGTVKMAVLAAPYMATTGSSDCTWRRWAAICTHGVRRSASDPTERPWP